MFLGAFSSNKARGAVRSESYGGYWKGEPSESLNPMNGFGMKQDRKGTSGINRHEAEKT
jgi:hypothetical protein